MPSITIWHRLEPRPQVGTLARGPEHRVPDPLFRGLQARVRDPLWMLSRQWQLGELVGDDAGSPVSATIQTESVPLTSYRPDPRGAASVPGASALAGSLPLEMRAEREPVALGLRGAVQLGLYFESLLRAIPAPAGVDVDQLVAAFRAAYSVDASAPAGGLSDDAAGGALRLAAAGRVTDGVRLYDAARGATNNVPPAPPVPASVAADVASVLQRFVRYRSELYAEPTADSAWASDALHYRFSVGVNDVALEAAEFRGGHLDWYSFSPGAAPLSGAVTAAPSVRDWTFLPQNLTFRGMPNARWWNFELGETDFGQLDAEHVDLAKLVVIEAALLYGNDWFELPVPLAVGTLSRVLSLVVADTFGGRTVIRPTEAQAPSGGRRWSMFKVASAATTLDFLALAPALGAVIDGPDVEDVLVARDEMSAMAWGIERKVPGPMDAAVDGYEPYLRRLAALPAPSTVAAGGPAIRYILGNSVPDNWIPLVPVKTALRDLVFRRGRMEITASGLTGAHAHGRVLEPWHPFYVVDEAIPRAGVVVTRYVRHARWSDGTTWTWVARRVRPGAGPGSSGLAFDIVEPIQPAPPP